MKELVLACVVAVVSCARLTPIEPELCGNGVIERGEDCDRFESSLFGADLHPGARRFAVAETLSHLERLVHTGRAECHEDGRSVSYPAPPNL